MKRQFYISFQNAGEASVANLDKMRYANGSTPTADLRLRMQKVGIRASVKMTSTLCHQISKSRRDGFKSGLRVCLLCVRSQVRIPAGSDQRPSYKWSNSLPAWHTGIRVGVRAASHYTISVV